MSKSYIIQPAHAKKWVKDSLSLTPSLMLSKIIEERWPWESSIFIVRAQENTPYHKLIQFDFGNKLESEDENKWLLKFTKENFGGEYIFIVENWLATPSSSYLKEDDLPYFTVKDDVYFLLDSSPKKIIKPSIILTNSTPSFHAYLLRKGINIKIGESFNNYGVLQELSEGVEMIVCGVYDGESYMVILPEKKFPKPII